MIKITNQDDGTTTVVLPAYSFEVPNREGGRALVEQILDRVREELEDHLELNARFIADGSAPIKEGEAAIYTACVELRESIEALRPSA